MEKDPLISICIPIFNAVQFIEETIECFINQSYKNWELILQDDCSTDGTWELIKKKYAKNPKIRIYQNTANLGIGMNWNEAYNHVKGEFVVIFNADDLVDEQFLEISLNYFKAQPDLDLVISSYIKSDEVKTTALLQLTSTYKGITYDVINVASKPNLRISWNYTLAKKESLEELKNKYGLFYPTQVCDSMLWFEAFKHKLKAFYTGEILGLYRMHETNSSRIPLGEFESTFMWMVPIYPEIYKLKLKPQLTDKILLIIKYFYACTKHLRLPKYIVIKNCIIYV
jgi:glycosyltransferase involved in cell wall biosynthesis